MIDTILVAALFVVPLAIFVLVQWREEERDRHAGREHHDDHWGGMGRPGSGL